MTQCERYSLQELQANEGVVSPSPPPCLLSPSPMPHWNPTIMRSLGGGQHHRCYWLAYATIFDSFLSFSYCLGLAHQSNIQWAWQCLVEKKPWWLTVSTKIMSALTFLTALKLQCLKLVSVNCIKLSRRVLRTLRTKQDPQTIVWSYNSPWLKTIWKKKRKLTR